MRYFGNLSVQEALSTNAAWRSLEAGEDRKRGSLPQEIKQLQYQDSSRILKTLHYWPTKAKKGKYSPSYPFQ